MKEALFSGLEKYNTSVFLCSALIENMILILLKVIIVLFYVSFIAADFCFILK